MVADVLKSILAAGCLLAAPAAMAQPSPLSAYVVMTGDGPVARAITAGENACPTLMLDGKEVAMVERASPADLPLRPTKSTVENSKPSRFPVRVCEAPIARNTRTAAIDGQRLPVPRRKARRIVVLGDTGCRIKASDNAYQACNDASAWPFARIAEQAAAWKPDLVLHVGDYLYRENPCVSGNAGCAGTPWGYGWDAWDADFFAPATPLLAAAPWIMVRGNHESCARAGQGWWRFLAAQPFVAGKDCDNAANDVNGDESAPFAVPLGGGAQIIAMDLAIMGEDTIAATDPRYSQIRETQRKVAELAKGRRYSFAVDHYPLLGLATSEERGVLRIKAGNAAARSTFGIDDPSLRLQGVDMLLAGHVHEWQQVDLGPAHPGQFVSGMAGTQEDVTEVPAAAAIGLEPAPGVKVERFDSWIGSFGFMTLERTGARRWRAEVHGLDGAIVRKCTIEGRTSRCG